MRPTVPLRSSWRSRRSQQAKGKRFRLTGKISRAEFNQLLQTSWRFTHSGTRKKGLCKSLPDAGSLSFFSDDNKASKYVCRSLFLSPSDVYIQERWFSLLKTFLVIDTGSCNSCSQIALVDMNASIHVASALQCGRQPCLLQPPLAQPGRTGRQRPPRARLCVPSALHACSLGVQAQQAIVPLRPTGGQHWMVAVIHFAMTSSRRARKAGRGQDAKAGNAAQDPSAGIAAASRAGGTRPNRRTCSNTHSARSAACIQLGGMLLEPDGSPPPPLAQPGASCAACVAKRRPPTATPAPRVEEGSWWRKRRRRRR